jgi:four helix bundle protein
MGNDFKDLIAWQKAIDLVVDVYKLTARFPDHERYGLTSQLRRSAVSIPSNIAEGHGRWTPAELVHGLRIANGSRQEAETQLIVAERLGYISDSETASLYSQLDEVGRIIFGLAGAIRV